MVLLPIMIIYINMCNDCLPAKRGIAASRSSVPRTSHNSPFEDVLSSVMDVLSFVYVSVAGIFSISYVFWFRQ